MLFDYETTHMRGAHRSQQLDLDAQTMRMTKAFEQHVAASQLSTAAFEREMQNLHATFCADAAAVLAKAAETNAAQHKYMAQRETEHERLIAQHVRRYAKLEALHATQLQSFHHHAPLAAAPPIDMHEDNDTKLEALHATQLQSFLHHALLAAAPPIDMHEDNDTIDTISAQSVHAFMHVDALLRATSPLPLFPVLPADMQTNN